MDKMASKLRVVLFEDHPLFLNVLEMALSSDEGIEVVAACLEPEGAISSIKQTPVDVLVADLEVDGDVLAGIKLIHRAKAIAPTLEAIVCSAHEDEEYVLQAIRAGAKGYLSKMETRADDLVKAVKAVGCGETFFSERIMQTVVRLLKEASQDTPAVHVRPVVNPLDEFTAREREIIPLLMERLSNPEIAQRLAISPATVKRHVSNILDKMGFESRYEVASYMRRYQKESKSTGEY